jgi:hypothetical protein
MFDAFRQLARQIKSKPGMLGVVVGATNPQLLSTYIMTPLPQPPKKYMPFRLLLWGVFGNNNKGDCTFAALAHAKMAVARLLKQRFTLTEVEVIASYDEYCKTYWGGKDKGAFPDIVLKNWTTTPMWGSTLTAWASVSDTDMNEWRQIISSYGVLLFTGNIPKPAMTYQLGANFKSFIHPIWKLTGTPDDDTIVGAHEMVFIGYDKRSFYAVTWGFVVRITIPWIQKYVLGANALVLPELVTAGKFDNVDVASLVADMPMLGK